MTSRRRPWVVLVFVTLLAAAATRAGWMSADGAGDVTSASGGGVPDRGLALPVGIDTIRSGTLELRVSATGQTVVSVRVALAARTAGRISRVLVEEGDQVRAGQVLARLDADAALLAVRQAEAGLAEAEARFREMTLFDDRIEDPGAREERAKAARARSGLERAEVEARRARLDLDDTVLRAPFHGKVANVAVGGGDVVGAGAEILTVIDPAPILVEVHVLESEIRWLRQGGRAEVRLPALPDTVFQGRIRSINPVIDPATRAARVTVVVANPDGRILAGMFARVSLEGRAFEDRILAPEEAVVEREGRMVVFVFEPAPGGPAGEGRARWVYVTTGLSNETYVELVDAEGTEVPDPGTLVITDGNYTLVHEAPVRIVVSPAGSGEP